MIAFVLSGGANRGPLEVGALQVLLEQGIQPDMLVGSSAGAINAIFLGLDPTPDGARTLGQLWKNVDSRQVLPGNRVTMLWRFLTGKDSLYSNEGLQHLIADHLPSGVEHFGDLEGIQVYIVATRLDTGEPRVFGGDPEDRLLDAIMASTALPPFLPPWPCGEELLVDGGIAADLPVRIAVDEGAREVYALHLVDVPPQKRQIHGLLSIAEQSIDHVLSRQLDTELEESASIEGVTLHYIPLTGFYNLPLWDLSKTADMIEEGRRQTQAYLEACQGVPTGGQPSLGQRVKRRLRAGFRRLQGMLSRDHRGLDDKMNPDSGAFRVRS
jgi:NTE family protein